MTILRVQGLRKQYPGFALRDVSFALPSGTITGLIGRNGAGKSTLLKSLLGFVHPDAGEIAFFGGAPMDDPREIRQRIGYVPGAFNFYPRKRLSAITAATAPFYAAWDEDVYRECLRRFRLDEHRTPSQLSEGMKVKYALTLALSHHAELLILDEPTSGLDPVSRDELLEVLLQLNREGATILYATHITTDLEKCTDDLLYLQEGTLRYAGGLADFLHLYSPADAPATLTDIMIRMEKEVRP